MHAWDGDVEDPSCLFANTWNSIRQRVALRTAKALHDQVGQDELWALAATASGLSTRAFLCEYSDADTLVADAVLLLTRTHLRHQAAMARVLARDGLDRWCNAVLMDSRAVGAPLGCELGWLAANPIVHGASRELVFSGFRAWGTIMRTALSRADRSDALAGSDAEALADTVLSLTQGGYMVACQSESSEALGAALDAAVRALASPGRGLPAGYSCRRSRPAYQRQAGRLRP